MKLTEKINEDIKQSMFNKDKKRLETLRSIKSTILNLEKEGKEITDELVVKAMFKMVKTRKDAFDMYSKGGRKDLMDVESYQISVIEEYLPKQATVEEMEDVVKEVVSQVNPSGMKDMGKMMGLVSKRFDGNVDGKTLSGIIKKYLI